MQGIAELIEEFANVQRGTIFALITAAGLCMEGSVLAL
mgnify:CR=1 FL=1